MNSYIYVQGVQILRNEKKCFIRDQMNEKYFGKKFVKKFS